jgi:hypothetical protein
VAPGRNLAILVEVAARNQLLRARGLNAARELASRLDQQLREAEGDAAVEKTSSTGDRCERQSRDAQTRRGVAKRGSTGRAAAAADVAGRGASSS